MSVRDKLTEFALLPEAVTRVQAAQRCARKAHIILRVNVRRLKRHTNNSREL